MLREQSGRGLEGRQRCKGGRNRSDRVMKETEERETERDEMRDGERGIGTAKDKTSILYYSNSQQTRRSLSHAREKERSDGYRRVRKRSLCECRILFSRDWSRSSLLSLQTYCP